MLNGGFRSTYKILSFLGELKFFFMSRDIISEPDDKQAQLIFLLHSVEDFSFGCSGDRNWVIVVNVTTSCVAICPVFHPAQDIECYSSLISVILFNWIHSEYVLFIFFDVQNKFQPNGVKNERWMTDFNSEDQICVWLTALCLSVSQFDWQERSDPVRHTTDRLPVQRDRRRQLRLHSAPQSHGRWRMTSLLIRTATSCVKYKSSGREETLLPGHLRHWSRDMNIRWNIDDLVI